MNACQDKLCSINLQQRMATRKQSLPPSPSDKLPVRAELIDRRIYIVRGKKVMLDSDLAELYQVTTGNFNLAVRRNIDRFPSDFMFQLTKQEHAALLLQFARAKTGRGGRQTPPYAFTELGVAMLSSVVNSDRAVQMNILIMRAFVRLREALAMNEALAYRIDELAATQHEHSIALIGVIREIKQLKTPRRRKPRIGFYTEEK
jgi:ORF6N domain